MKKLIAVEGMKCEGCGNAVKNKFETITGVENVTIDLDSRSAFVETKKELTVDELNGSLSDTSYRVTGISTAE